MLPGWCSPRANTSSARLRSAWGRWRFWRRPKAARPAIRFAQSCRSLCCCSCSSRSTRSGRSGWKTVMKHLVQISASWFDSHHSGDIMARILTDFNDGMQNALNIPIQNTIALLLNGISSISILFALDWHIGLTILGISMLSIALTSLFVRPGRDASAAIRRGNGKVTEDIANLLGAANLIKAHGLYSYVQQKLRASVQASENCWGMGCACLYSSALWPSAALASASVGSRPRNGSRYCSFPSARLSSS